MAMQPHSDSYSVNNHNAVFRKYHSLHHTAVGEETEIMVTFV